MTIVRCNYEHCKYCDDINEVCTLVEIQISYGTVECQNISRLN